ncbi:LpxL/LpxP family acyltransferase [Pseudoalteromonas sp. T1lg10]|uniref:LpxL/LpxP family acyltransferase n=1 Tax=Pseudoalteromonas sp. T1lg10 TaxID=2077093 RepID=UPI000CF5DA99|nr:acyltransferase [Pseudoalteromonas sp. T1lg10]
MSEQHWSKTQERGSYLGMQFLLGVYKLFGRRVLWLFMFVVVFYFYVSGRKARRASLDYWRRLHTFDPSQPKPSFGTGLKHFCTFADSAFDKIDAWLGRITPAQLRYQNQHLFDDLVARRQGAIFIGSHLGNLEVCRALGMRHQNCVINVLVFTEHAVEFNRTLGRINPNVSVNLIQVSDMGPDLAILLKSKVEQGEFVVIVGDRTSTSAVGRVHYASFLGEPAPFAQGPFILAALLECPIYWLFCTRSGDGFDVHFSHYSEALSLPRKTRQQALAQVIDDYAQELQRVTLQCPYQWFNFYDFWQRDEDSVRHKEK